MPLSYSKCTECRADRKKCLPEVRVWPSKCQRCDEKKLPCSEPRMGRPGRPKRKREPETEKEIRDIAVYAHKRKIDHTSDFRQQGNVGLANLPSEPSTGARFQKTSENPTSQLPDWVFLLSWYPMLKQAMTKLQILNNDALKDFDLDRRYTHSVYKAFEKFNEDLVPLMLRQATNFLLREKDHSNQVVFPPLLVRLLGDCINKPLPNTQVRCRACSNLLDHDEPFRVMFAQEGDLVNEVYLRVSRLSGHMKAKQCLPGSCRTSCDDTRYIQSELHAIDVLSHKITVRINRIFQDGGTGLELPPTVRNSAIFIPDYEGLLDDLFIGQGYLDCLGRTALHRLFDLGPHLILRTGMEEADLGKSSNAHTHQDLLGRSALHIAIRNGYMNYLPIEELLDDSNINIQTVYGHTPLHYSVAADKSFMSLFEIFADHETLRLDPNLKDITGRSAFSYAVRQGDLKAIDYFINTFDIDVNVAKGSGGVPPLIEAILHSRMDVIEYLLKLPNIDPNIEDEAGKTSLHWVIIRKSFASLELLGKLAKMHWNKSSQEGFTPLHNAVSVLIDDRFLEYLLARPEGVDVNHGDNHGRRPLHLAAMYGQYNKIDSLLKHAGINVNAQTKHGWTPLMYAMQGGAATRVLKLLLNDKRIDLNLKDHDGASALDIARRQRRSNYRGIIAYIEAQTLPSHAHPYEHDDLKSFSSKTGSESSSGKEESPESFQKYYG